MTTSEIAHRLGQLCNEHQFEKAQKELFAIDALSIEPHESASFDKETKGLEAILEKGKKFNELVGEITNCKVSEPLISGNAIAIKFNMEVKAKNGKQMPMSEIGVYEVKDGQIISERFFV